MFKVTVKPDKGKSYEVEVKQRDLMRWEKNGNDRNAITSLQDGFSLTNLFELTWLASTRLGKYSGELEAFENEVDIEVESDESDENLRSGTEA